MPPLTLEQVLARSMRLPRQRTQRYVSKLYRGGGGGDEATGSAGVRAPVQRATHGDVVAGEWAKSGFSQSGHTTTTATERGQMSATSARQAKLNFFDLMDREDAARRTGRLTIHRSAHLVRNGADLTTFLSAALHTGDWVDGLRAFAEATALPALAALLHEETGTGAGPAPASPLASASSLALTGVNPNVEHVLLVLDMCARAHRGDLVERIGSFFAPTFPEAFAHAVELLVTGAVDGTAVSTATTPAAAAAAARVAATAALSTSASASASALSSAPVTGWRAGFAYLTERCPLPAAEIPVEAFNVCLRGCESARDWRGALTVVRAMGPNPLQKWTAPGEAISAQPSDDGAAAAPPGVSSSISTPPSPNVVSYATLIATLEQCGKDQMASEVLNRLPAVEKEEITASYAALIVVWSNQVLSKQRRRF